MTINEQRVLLAGAVLALVLLVCGAKRSPGASAKVPEFAAESHIPFTPVPGAPIVGVDQLAAGYNYTPHRYPATCGADITVLIHRGYHTMSLPNTGDMTWLAAPPSEEEL